MFAQTATGFLAVLFFFQLQFPPFSGAVITNDPVEAFTIAREAYPFFVPIINNWRVLSLSTNLEEDPVQFDQFRHGDDLQPPNENVVYSITWVDLRKEPRVVTVPRVENRYYSLQIIDGYTHNIGIVSARNFTGSAETVSFIVAGPGQCTPGNEDTCFCDEVNEVDGIVRSESLYALLLIRIQVFGPLDIALFLSPIQQQFGVQKRSDFCGEIGPVADNLPFFFFVPLLASVTPDYFHFANLLMEVMFDNEIHESEVTLFERFARIGVIPGEPFPPQGMSDQVLGAIQLAIIVSRGDLEREILNPSTADERGGWQLVIDPPQFGTREIMQGRYLTRAASAREGIYGLDPQEAFYPFTRTTRFGVPLNGARNTPYYIHFDQRRLPPVFGDRPPEDLNTAEGLNSLERSGFWSITMHNRFNLTTFVPNPINRFSVGSREQSTFCSYDDGSFPIIMQAEPPTEPAFFRNWLPAPDGFFVLLARLYAPRPEAIAAPYLPPPVRRGLPRRVPTNCFPPLS